MHSSIKQIQREQLQLSKIEKELSYMVAKVNESINSLKVEELQLRASAAIAPQIETPVTGTTAPTAINTTARDFLFNQPYLSNQVPVQQMEPSVDDINSQEIDLDLFVRPFGRHDEEMDETGDTKEFF